MPQAKPKPKVKDSGQKESHAPQQNNTWLAAALLFLIPVLLYLPALRGGLLWDDAALLTDNAAVKSPGGIISIWTTNQSVDFVPLTLSSFWLEWRLWQENLIGYHLVSILLHALDVVLLWRVLRRLRVPGCWFAALLFAVHPVCAASVAWIAEQKNTLSTALYLLSLLWYLRYDESESENRKKFFILSLAAFLFALLAKSAVAVLPVVFLLCIWWRRGRIAKQDIVRTLPFFALAFAVGVVTFLFQRKLIASGLAAANDPLLIRLIAGGWAIWFYLWKILLPIHLTMIYPRWEIDPHSVGSYLPGLLAVAAVFLFWHFRRGWGRPWFFAFAYFLIAIGPVLGVLNMAYFSISRVSDHLQYLAMPGIIALVVGGISRRFPLRTFQAAAVAAAAVLAILTWHHEKVFNRPATLWRDNAAKNPSSWRVFNSLGAADFAEDNFNDAVAEYLKGLEIKPASGDLHYNLANAYYKMGRTNDAIVEFQAAIQNGSDTYDAHHNLAVILGQLGRWDEAIPHYQDAVRLKPGSTDALGLLAGAYINAGVALDKKKDYDGSIRDFQEALKLDPKDAGLHKNLGLVLSRKGNTADAIAEFQESLKLKDDAGTHSELGNLLGKNGRLDDAQKQFEAALKLDPSLTAARNGLGVVFDSKGKADKAIEQFTEAVRQQPDFIRARINLASALLRQGRRADAIAQFKEVLKYQPNNPDALQQLRRLSP